MHQGVRIQVILVRAVVPAHHLHEVRRIDRAHIPVLRVREHRALVPPGGQVLHRRRPLTVILSAVAFHARVVRARHIDAIMTRVVRILEHPRLPVRHVLPKGQVRIANEISGLRLNPDARNNGQTQGQQKERKLCHLSSYMSAIAENPSYTSFCQQMRP